MTKRVTLATINEYVDKINEKMISIFSKEKIYLVVLMRNLMILIITIKRNS